MICEGVEKHLYFIKSEGIGFIFATFLSGVLRAGV